MPTARLPKISSDLDFVYAFVGAPDRAAERPLQIIERAIDTGYGVLGVVVQSLMVSPEYAPVRKSARFKDLMRKLGRIEQWRARGWPDLCRPAGADGSAFLRTAKPRTAARRSHRCIRTWR